MTLEQINGGEFRFYRYDPEDGTEPTDLLSVTSIRSLVGESYMLVNWKMANLADAALGTMKRTIVGPRGGVKDVRLKAEYPSEFVRKYTEGEGTQESLDDLRKWLRERAESPRNVAAMRGTLTHDAIEHDIPWTRIERPYVELKFSEMSARDQKRIAGGVTDEDVYFIRHSMRHYWEMRRQTNIVILAREVRVVNLTAGYAGTFDALVWYAPIEVDANGIDGNSVTLADIARIGGDVVMLDWKTATGIHTDNVVQAHAYLAAEFAIVNGKRDDRVTDLLVASDRGGLVHVRPNGCAIYEFEFSEEVIRAFLGSVAFARFLAKYDHPTDLWTSVAKYESEEPDE